MHPSSVSSSALASFLTVYRARVTCSYEHFVPLKLSQTCLSNIVLTSLLLPEKPFRVYVHPFPRRARSLGPEDLAGPSGAAQPLVWE